MSARFGRSTRARLTAACAVLAVVAVAAGCSSDDGDDKGAAPGSTSAPAKGGGKAAQVKLPDGCTTTLDAETPAQVSVAVSQALYTSSPVVVVAPADATALDSAVAAAEAAGAPLLVTDEAADAPSIDATASPEPTSGSAASAVSFDADTADCAAPPAAVTPSSTPSSTTSPSSSSSPSSDADDTESDDTESDEGDDATSEPTTTASPAITPASFSTALGTEDSADGSCLDVVGSDSENNGDKLNPSPSATATSTPSSSSSSSTASPSATSSSGATDGPTSAPTEASEPVAVNAPLDPTVAAEIKRLNPEAVLAATPDTATALRDALPGVKVVENAADLPKTSAPSPLSGLAVLVPSDEDLRAGSIAAAATAKSAGASTVGVQNGDPRAGSCSVQALFKAKPTRVLGVGDFGSADSLSYRMGVVGTGVELPGGGQLFFPGRRLVALYGYPGAPELGVLGAQGVDASITRAKSVAAQYDDISDVPVIATFEVIATVAQGAAGSDGNYSAESTIEQLKPWVEKADEAGMYVILDLQSGRSNFLTQAKRYAELLKNPHVGLALDPEWRLFGSQLPLRQIGHVDSSEINEVIDWLADFTVENNLPQKLLVLHQFSLSMITNRSAIDTSHDSLSILVHMDGQGEPIQKEGTWRIVTNTMPNKIWMGWKNFYKKDTRLMTPRETLDRTRVPVMISYQ